MDERLLNRVEAWGIQFQSQPQRTPFQAQIAAQFPGISPAEIKMSQARLNLLASASGLLPQFPVEFALEQLRKQVGAAEPITLDANIEVHSQTTGAVLRYWTARAELLSGETLQDWRNRIVLQVQAANNRYEENKSIVNRWFDWVM